MLRSIATAVALVALSAMGVSVPGAAPALAQNTPAPADAKVYFIWPRNGQVIRGGKLWVRMGLSNMGIAPAEVVRPNTGHHHLIVDADPPPLDEPIPSTRNFLHFGGGQTEARIELPPGKHTLQLVLGDPKHYPHTPPVLSEKITITVR